MEKFNSSMQEVQRAFDLLTDPKTSKETGILYTAKLQFPFHHLRMVYATNGREYALSTDLFAHNRFYDLPPHIFKNLFPISKPSKLAIEKNFEVISDKSNYLSHARVRNLADILQYDLVVSQDQRMLNLSIEKKLCTKAEYATKINISTGFEDEVDLLGISGMDAKKFCLPKPLNKTFDKDYVAYLHFIEIVISGVHAQLFEYEESSQRKKLEKLIPRLKLDHEIILHNKDKL